MREFLVAVMTVSLCGGIVSILAPDGKGSLKKQIGFAISVCCCVVLIYPICKGISRGKFDFKYDVSINKEASSLASYEIISRASELICEEAEYAINQRYSVEGLEIKLVLDTDDISEIVIESAIICGKGDLSEAAKYAKELLGCEVNIEEGEG
ncbi:MAG: hypothetical protein IJO00_01535 [Clostridia bacterium]|nr:hypothetical protein [Clostridia bacterium]